MKKGKFQSQSSWLCHCDCGGEKVILEANLVGGISLSCGCLLFESRRKKRGGWSKIRFYGHWYFLHLMEVKGMKVSPWPDFESFRIATHDEFLRVSKVYGKLRLGRKDVLKPLGTDNWRWCEKRRENFGLPLPDAGRQVEIDGRKMNLAAWAGILGVTRERARQLLESKKLEERVRQRMEEL
jgi:hypothetical protein